MSSSPFIISQKPFTIVECGNEATGIIKLVNKGFISVAEQMELDQIAFNSYKYQLLVGELICKLIQEKGITQGQAQKMIESPNQYLSVVGDYLKDIELIWEKYYDSKNDNLTRVTTAIKWRSLTSEECEKFEKLKGTETMRFMQERDLIDWGDALTKELPQSLFEEILEFIVGEQRETEEKGAPLSLSKKEMNLSDNKLSSEPRTGENTSGNSRKRGTKGSTT